MKTIAVIGGGAAGMFAAIHAAEEGLQVHLFERNEKLGKKLFITGKGRCNVTTACESLEDLMDHVVTNPRFLYAAFTAFDNHDMISFLENEGLRLKEERGQRMFPVSDKSSDVIRTLERKLDAKGVNVHLNTGVRELKIEDSSVTGLVLDNGSFFKADAVIIATGGVSYPSTGSTGDGYRLAQAAGHKIKTPGPSLVPMVAQEKWCQDLQGLSLKNVRVSFRSGKKKIYEETGEMMFTHFGITGPLVLSASAYAGKYLEKGHIQVLIDLKPGLSRDQLDQRILRDFDKYHNRQIRNALSDLLPASMIPVIISLSVIDPYKTVHDLTKEERLRLLGQMKEMQLHVTGLRGLNEAIITQGGIHVKEVKPDTMASKLISHLYFAGEVLDLDAVTGGFNLQIAWSTGRAAGLGAAKELKEGEF